MAEKKLPSIKKNFLLNVALLLPTYLFPLLIFPYAARILGPSGTGRVSFAISVTENFAMLAQLGIPVYGIRACAKARDDRVKLSTTVQELLLLNLMTDVISYALFFIALRFVPQFARDRELFLVTSIYVLLTTIGMEWMYKGLEEYVFITTRSLLCRVIALGAMFLLIHKESDYIVYGGIMIFATGASGILNFIHARQLIDIQPLSKCSPLQHLKPVIVFFAMTCATMIYTNLDKVMLGLMTTDTDVGYYDAAIKIKTILVGAATSIGVVVLPRASYYVETQQWESFTAVCKKALNYVLLVAVPVSVYFLIYTENVMVFISGEAYAPASLPLRVLMPTVILIGITNVMGLQILVPTGREKVVLRSEIAGALTDLMLNLILIPSFGATGAAIGTLVAEVVVLMVQGYALKDQLKSLFQGHDYVGIIIAAALGAVASVLAAGHIVVGNLLILIVSAMLYFGLYGTFLLIRREPLLLEAIGFLTDKWKR